MLTRLQVSGFKNLEKVDIRFGPFTCIAGPNGVGKSNVFDGIRFLSALADRPLMEAALAIRGDDNGGRMGDVRSLFLRCGDDYAQKMSFEAEMIIPSEGEDDLGAVAKATITFLKYSVELAYKVESGSLEILKEELGYIPVTKAHKYLRFPHSTSWRESVIRGRRAGTEFISTEGPVINLHQDGGSRGKPLSRRQAKSLPRTMLSATNAAESPTAMLARQEMRSWRILQLEPSALRRPDEFASPTKLGTNGSHLAATLYRLAHQNGSPDKESANDANVYIRVANRLAELIDDVYMISVDRDVRRELLTLSVEGKDRTPHAARALSDGTLRFLALAVLEQDPQVQGVLCLEEPENGIHPARIPAMIKLLQDIATNVDEPVSRGNALRQIIVNTHSPAVVLQVPEDTLLVAEPRELICLDKRFNGVRFSCLKDTWRATKLDSPADVCKMGDLMAYLNPVLPAEDTVEEPQTRSRRRAGYGRRERVFERLTALLQYQS